MPTEADHLTHHVDVRVRFNEADAMQVARHGHYIRFFEDAREAFGERYGIGYKAIQAEGIMAPVVSFDCAIKRPARFGDVLTVEARLLRNEAAKLEFRYTICRDGELLATGSSVQVFVDHDWQLLLQRPPILEKLYERWDDSAHR